MVEEDVRHYTQAIADCVKPLSCNNFSLDLRTRHYLGNLIQGLFLEHILCNLCKGYNIREEEKEKKLLACLMILLRDNFFETFRKKVKENPEIIPQIAFKIFHNESRGHHKKRRTNRLYKSIFRRFFSSNLGLLYRKISSHNEITKLLKAQSQNQNFL